MREWWDNWWVCWEKLKFDHPKTACSLQYVSLFLFVFLVGHVLSGMANHVYFRYPFNDTSRHPISITANLTINGATETYVAEMYADNARSILCTLVGCEAAIVAIVVSLTLIAIELTASEYSPRVIDISLRNLDMWFLLSIYGISIFLGIILIKQLPYDSRIPFEDVSFAFWLGVFAYAALFPYLRNIIWLLKPKNIIKRLASEITCEKIKKEDKFQPIVDITLRSIMKHDFETTRVALRAVTYQATQAISSGCGAKISESFCDQLQGLGKLAARLTDEESAIEVIENLENFGRDAAKKGLEEATTQASSSLCYIGRDAAKKGLEEATTQASSSLGCVGKAAVENKLKEATVKTAAFLEDVGGTAANFGEKLEAATIEAEKSLRDIGVDAAKKATEKKELGVIPDAVASSLNVVGKIAKEKGLNEALELAKSYLSEVIKEAETQRLDVMTRTIGSTQEES